MVLQGAIGYTQYFSHLPALLVGVHVFGATAVWVAMLWFYDGLTHTGGRQLRTDPSADRITDGVPSVTANGGSNGVSSGVADGVATPVTR
jgi:cytochrome c oxidase assembly protein subunit 15